MGGTFSWSSPNGQTQLFVGRHLIHGLQAHKPLGCCVRRTCSSLPERTFATVDHIVPTNGARTIL